MAKYLYNGYILPELPVVDGYPYVYMFTITGEKLDALLGEYAGQSECMYAAHYSVVPYTYDGQRFGVRATGERVKFYAYIPEAHEAFIFYQDYVIGDNTSNFGLPVESDVDQKVFWCNTDLVYDDGSIFLAASEPVSTVFVLPDGTELPALPDGCFEKYPYGVIVYSGAYLFMCTGFPEFYSPETLSGDTGGRLLAPNAGGAGYGYVDGMNDWTLDSESETTGVSLPMDGIELRWSNHDILTATAKNDDGTYEIGTDLYRKSDVNYRVYGGWLNSMGNQARRLGNVSGALKPGEMESVFSGATLEPLTVTPTTEAQTFTPESPCIGFSVVTVEAAPDTGGGDIVEPETYPDAENVNFGTTSAGKVLYTGKYFFGGTQDRGHALPPLPNVEDRPKMLIYKHPNYNRYELYCYTEDNLAFVYSTSNTTIYAYPLGNSVGVVRYIIAFDNIESATEWTYESKGGLSCGLSGLLWSNFDIYYGSPTGGNLAFSASAPVPETVDSGEIDYIETAGTYTISGATLTALGAVTQQITGIAATTPSGMVNALQLYAAGAG